MGSVGGMGHSRLNVVWISMDWPSPSRHTGGVGRYVKRLAEEMGHHIDLTVVTQPDPEPVDGVRFVEIPVTGSRIDRYYRAPFRIRSSLESMSPNLIHAHGDDWAIHTRIPIVRSFYGTSWSEARSSKGLRRINHMLLAGFEHYSARKATTKLAIAPESMRAFECDFIIPPLAHRPSRIERQPLPTPHVVFIGSYYGRKRGYLVQDAVQDARRALGTDIRLSAIGPESDAGNWDESIHHLSGMSDQEVQEVLASAWVLLAPSEYEGFGIPLVEALDMGVPVISSKTPGSTYIEEIGGANLPLVLCEKKDEITGELIARVVVGPEVSAAERESAISCCDHLYQLASANQLLEIYEGSLA